LLDLKQLGFSLMLKKALLKTICSFGLILPSLSLSSLGAEPAKSAFDPLTVEITALMSIGDCSFPTFSPDGKTLAFVSNMSGTEQIWTVPVTGGWPTQLTSTEALVGATWSPTSEYIAFMAGTGSRQMYVIRANGSGLKQLAASNNQISCWLPDGKRIIFASNCLDNGVQEPFIADPHTGNAHRLGSDLKLIFVDDVTKDCKQALASLWKEKNNTVDFYLLNIEDGTKKLLTMEQDKAMYSGGGINRATPLMSPDGQTIYCVSDKGREKNAFGKIKIGADGKASPIEYTGDHPGQTCRGFCMDRERVHAATVWSSDNGDCIDVIDLTSGKVTAIPKLPVESCMEIEFSPDGKTLSLSLGGSADPFDIWLYKRAERTFTQLTHSQHPGVDLYALAKPEKVTFKSEDGTTISAQLYKPNNSPQDNSKTKAHPFVISCSGSMGYSPDFQALHAHGIGVLVPRIREAIVCKDKSQIANGEASKTEAADIKACVDYLVSTGLANARKIGIMGFSHGGRVAMVGLTEFPDLFAAGLVHAGEVDYATYVRDNEPTRRAIFEQRNFGDEQSTKDAIRNLSPILRLDRVKSPIMVQHGATDAQVPVGQADELVDGLKKHGTPVEYVFFPDEGHWIHKLNNRVKATSSMVAFFVRELK
jgi:dipeptidyl aminopeptidase/acylaminoacyl peptidase